MAQAGAPAPVGIEYPERGETVNERLEAARAYLQKKPNDRFALYSLAMELRKLSDWPACFAAFEDLLARHRDDGAGHYHYAVALRTSGDRDAALGVVARGKDACARSGDAKTAAELDSLRVSLETEDEEDDELG